MAARVFRKMLYFVANFDLGDQTAKQIAIQFADRPTCYEIHTHLAVKLTVVCGRIFTSLLQTAATGSERVR